MRKPLLWVLAIPAVIAAAGGAARIADAGDLRETLTSWVETRQLISEETNRWREEKDYLRLSAEMLERELLRLEKDIARLEAETAGARLEQERLREENQNLETTGNRVSERIGAIETALSGIAGSFPQPLRDRTGELLARLPADDPAGASLGRRTQTVVGLLGEADRFQESVHAPRQIIPGDDGSDVEVRVLYLGLGQAYFLSPDGERAGIGRPGEDGWDWTSRPGIAREIRRAFAVYDNEAAPEFSRLPASLDNR